MSETAGQPNEQTHVPVSAEEPKAGLAFKIVHDCCYGGCAGCEPLKEIQEFAKQNVDWDKRLEGDPHRIEMLVKHRRRQIEAGRAH